MKSIKKTAQIAGLLYLLVAVFATLSAFIKSDIIVPGDPAITAYNIVESESLFRLGFMSEILHQVIQIFLVILLYRLLKPVNRNYALLMAIIGLIGVPISMANMLNQTAALQLLGGASYLAAFNTEQLHAMMAFFLDLFDHGFYILYIPWGLWLLPMGYLIFRSGFIPKILGVFLIIGGFGYLFDFITLLFLPDFVEIRFFTFFGEPLLALWLLIKGVNINKWEQKVQAVVD